MATWLVRAGRKDEPQREREALDKGILAIRFAGMQEEDLTNTLNRDDVKRLYVLANPHDSPNKTGQRVRSLWLFRHKVQIGDRVIMRPRGQSIIAVGEITGEYKYCPDSTDGFAHCRTVKWINKKAPISNLSEKCIKSINRPPTVLDLSTYTEEIEGLLAN